ncbi:hypothetical protein [Afifella marina]|uniref:Uncharacterized protein n=1 Tax=Afifella marina DSM 2698 TaxID=1120955 RepID=A0A1G5N978_AFIMA|nr:hypothetical protein [Afifella marina]MBK1623087.1 hypothetical protein [Afifella marina DSM 2698]MBK1626081.1 hypothetical protein [Afifella marina]MBK5916959.1 hypothetical protein [Afifella marina]RAI21962.1 hypothetical protein CH311_04375 [Afifella marina DSM 2698]SCZ33995.1 hypothetical protein SAMN03080610_01617 [Afifella marina DSM 2698]
MTARKISKSAASKPFPVRLTDTERADLEHRSGSTPVGTYVKQVLFDGSDTKRRSVRAPVKDHAALASMLARMGASRSAEWLATLAHAAESGTLPVDKETTEKLRQACHDVLVIRMLLMQALGMHADHDDHHHDDDRDDDGQRPGGPFTRASHHRRRDDDQ